MSKKQILKGLVSHVKMFVFHPNDNGEFPGDLTEEGDSIIFVFLVHHFFCFVESKL